ncbi:MAG: PepSY-associated TM helix domain-containing protein [Adhaeribacter sp.]
MGKFLGKNLYKLHQWTGLIAGVFVLVMGLSGSVLVFHQDLEMLEHRNLWQVDNSAPVSIDKAYQTITRAYPHWEIRLQRFSADPGQTLIFSLRRPEERLLVFVHPSQGQLLAVLDPTKTVTNWVLKLHYALHAGLAGEVLVFVAGLAWLISLLTGLYIYRKALLRVLLFQVSFKKKTRRSLASSLHRVVGVWALLLNLVMVGSGLLISYGIVANGLKALGTAPKEIASPVLGFSIDAALQHLRRQHPHFEPTYMRFPKAAGQPLAVNGRLAGEPFYYSQYYNAATFEQATGRFLELKVNTAADASTQLDSISKGLHFVEYGNWLVKVLFCLVGLSAPLMSVTGFLLWKWRKKKAALHFA